MTLISTTEELFRQCQPLYAVEYITIDTEFIRESTFFPELCLIQIAGPEKAFVIDALSPTLSLQPLFDLLQEPSVLKVFHAARQDIEIIYHLSGKIPHSIFDTQIAAMVCGFGESVSYETLVMQLINRKLDKSQRFTDWRLRPLTDKQIEYALGDVVYLRQVYTKLQKKIERNNRLDWLKEEMDALYDKKLYFPHPEDAWLKLKPKKVDSKSLCVLKELAAWRDVEARRLNVPRRHVLSDDVLIELAANKPKTTEDLQISRAYSKNFHKSSMAETLLAIIETSLLIPEDLWPKKEASFEGVDHGSAALDMLKLALKLISDKEGVASKLIANVSDLKRLIRKDYKDESEVALLHGWRYQLFGEMAVGLLNGVYSLGLENNQIKFLKK